MFPHFSSLIVRIDTERKTREPPTSVKKVGVSTTPSQTHMGPNENSKSIKSINSAATRDWAASINNEKPRL